MSHAFKKDWIKEAQDRFYSSNDYDWGDLHSWISRRIGQAIRAQIPLLDAISFLRHSVGHRHGKTPLSAAYRDIEKTAQNLYAKDSGYIPFKSNKFIPSFVPERTKPTPSTVKNALSAVVTVTNTSELDIINKSPTMIPPGLHHHARLFFQTMFNPDDYIFAAHTERISKHHQPNHIKTAKEWADSAPSWNEWDSIQNVPQFVCISPLTGKPDSQGSYRSGSCRARVPYMLVEIDESPLQDQRDLWMTLILEPVPVVALVYSGNKSYHAWIKIDEPTIEESDKQVYKYYSEVFDMLGVDSNKKGKATLARVPGSYRRDKEGKLESLPNNDEAISSNEFRASRLIYLNASLVSEVCG